MNFHRKAIFYHILGKTNSPVQQQHFSPIMPLYRDPPIDFHPKSMGCCLDNGKTGLERVKGTL